MDDDKKHEILCYDVKTWRILIEFFFVCYFIRPAHGLEHSRSFFIHSYRSVRHHRSSPAEMMSDFNKKIKRDTDFQNIDTIRSDGCAS